MPVVYVRDGVELPERQEHDFYPTDRDTVVDALATVRRGGFIPSRILDPGAGPGIWGEIARARWPKSQITGIEIRGVHPPKAYDVWVTGSFFDPELPLSPPYDLVMGNPPYSDAETFVRRGLSLLRDGGRLIFLLKLSFMAGQRRAAKLYAEFPPRWYVPCSRRPSFTGDGHTAPEEYALYIWKKGYKGKEELLRVPVSARPSKRRPRIYANPADRQAAWRHRKKVSNVP